MLACHFFRFLFTLRGFSNRDETVRETNSTMDTKFVLRVRKSDFPPVASLPLLLSRIPRLSPGYRKRRKQCETTPTSCLSSRSVSSRLHVSFPLLSYIYIYNECSASRNFIEFAAERAAFHGQLWRPTLSSPLALYSTILKPPTYNLLFHLLPLYPSPLRRDECGREKNARHVYCLFRFGFRLFEHTNSCVSRAFEKSLCTYRLCVVALTKLLTGVFDPFGCFEFTFCKTRRKRLVASVHLTNIRVSRKDFFSN